MSDFDVVQKARFDDTIIITDPCYVISSSLWASGDINLATGKGIEEIGITDYIWGSTNYGDWCCTVDEVERLPTQSGEKPYVLDTLGHFGADAGLVAVFKLRDVIRANPTLSYCVISSLKALGWAVVIDEFEGTVSLTENYRYRHVMGRGRTTNGESIAFFSRQI